GLAVNDDFSANFVAIAIAVTQAARDEFARSAGAAGRAFVHEDLGARRNIDRQLRVATAASSAWEFRQIGIVGLRCRLLLLLNGPAAVLVVAGGRVVSSAAAAATRTARVPTAAAATTRTTAIPTAARTARAAA